ncbi:MAG TPA: prolyl oligopeptidase family serine peptidase [Streptosporangiaceae bacterium]
MRDAQLPAMRGYLAAERAYYEQEVAPLRGLRDELRQEMTGRVAAAEESVRWRQGSYWYCTRTVPGQQFEQFCRAAGPDARAQLLLDENALLSDPACGGGYVALGVREVSPDGRLLAYSVDFAGDEVYQLRIRDLASGQDLPDRIEQTYYGLAWAADAQSLLYVVTDAEYRPHEVWRHQLGTSPDQDVLVLREDDQRFELSVRAARSGQYLLIETESRDTTETLFVPAADPGSPPAVLAPRRRGIEYRADHARGPDGGDFYLVSNDAAAEFRLVRAPVRAPGRDGWTEVIAGAADTRLVSCDVFGRYLVVQQRRAAASQLRVLDRKTGAQRLIEPLGPEISLQLAVNQEYGVAAVTVRTESLIDPPAWHEVDLATGAWQLRKRQDVPGYDPAGYASQRLTAAAPDGTMIPVTIAYRRGRRPDGTAPCLLYGYGAYEACSWPEFSVLTPSLLDRGFGYAVAHVRGGGEGGRHWWLDGRLTRKRNTFTDFIAAADMLADQGWAAGDRIVSRGLSAGGLLQGAVYAMAPRRWRAMVAEVPFVDCVTTMLDPSIPLTITEWDEWGDPRDPEVLAYLRSYSPYDNVPTGRRPDLLVTGSLHDPRVLIHEPAKWVARLRATADGAAGQVLFRAELGTAGHTGPTGRYDRLGYEAEIGAFIVAAAG